MLKGITFDHVLYYTNNGVVYRFSPAVITPVDLTGFHGTNERMSVENMGRISNGFAQIIVAMDQGD